jgi:hypothetical protein
LLSGIELRHAIPGRVRLRIPAIKGQQALAEEVRRQLAALAVIRRVEVSTITGSVLVVYDPADSAALEELGRLMIPDLVLDGPPIDGSAGAEAGSPPLSDAIADYARQLNTRVAAATGHSDLRMLLPASLFVGGILRLLTARKVLAPTWYDLLWFSFGTFFTLNRPSPEPPDTGRAAEELPTAATTNGKAP